MSGYDYDDLVRAARAQITEIGVPDLAARLDAPPLLVDVREPHEMATGVLPGAALVPRGALEKGIDHVAPDRDAEVVLYCTVGNRSALATLVLEQMGYTSVSSLAGGIAEWRASGLPVEMPLPGDDTARYARHLVLDEIGPEGQERLGGASVLVVGAGGLGSPAALYLAAAGVGTLTIADPDVVDVSNLQRQILHATSGIGTHKTDSAAAALARLNPGVVVRTRTVRLDASNAEEIAAGHDVVVDGTDSFPARYLLNDTALRLRIPLVHGSVLRFEGQVTVIDPYAGPCYRCVFPEPPPPGVSPSCAEAGVLGAVAGVVGSLQAVEAVKLILGAGEPLAGRLAVYDGLAGDLRVFTTARDPACPACGDPSAPPPLVDYDETCRPVRP
ncbi:MAG: molybdopterin-synthase adenylyltransferase MoeB [Actinobacteria bacterium]|nr:molybdopterin-synthase adenylyltransferase MoeB [Actinomycetota bacterium]